MSIDQLLLQHACLFGMQAEACAFESLDASVSTNSRQQAWVMQQPTSDQATGGQDGHRHVVFAADVAAGYDVLAGTRAPAHSGVARADSAELPVSCFTPADSSVCAADSEVAASVLRSRPSAVGDSSGLVTGITEVANPLSRHPSGVPVLRRSGTSLAHDGSAFAAIDMPPAAQPPGQPAKWTQQ